MFRSEMFTLPFECYSYTLMEDFIEVKGVPPYTLDNKQWQVRLCNTMHPALTCFLLCSKCCSGLGKSWT